MGSLSHSLGLKRVKNNTSAHKHTFQTSYPTRGTNVKISVTVVGFTNKDYIKI